MVDSFNVKPNKSINGWDLDYETLLVNQCSRVLF